MNVKLLVIRPNLAQFHVVEFFQVYLDGVTRWLDYLWNNWTFSIMKICPIWKNYAIEGSKFCPILPKQILKNCQIPLRFCQSDKSSGHTVHKQRESSQRYGTIMVMPNICSHPPLHKLSLPTEMNFTKQTYTVLGTICIWITKKLWLNHFSRSTPCSVTRLGYFGYVMMTKFTTKVAQISSDFWDILKDKSIKYLSNKNCCGYFLTNWATFYHKDPILKSF